MCAASFGWCHLVNAYRVKSGWSCGWQIKLCDPVNTCHSVVLRDCLGRKNALYKYLILYLLLPLIFKQYAPCGPWHCKTRLVFSQTSNKRGFDFLFFCCCRIFWFIGAAWCTSKLCTKVPSLDLLSDWLGRTSQSVSENLLFEWDVKS